MLQWGYVAAEEQTPKKLTPLLEAKLQVAEQLGALMEFWGFKRALGRIWTVLYLSDHPLTAAELGEELDLSPSAISLAMTELKRWGVVHEDISLSTRTRRAQTYRAEREVWNMVNNVFRQRELPLIMRTQETVKAAITRLEGLPSTPELRHALKALKTLSSLSAAARTMLETLLATGRASAEALRKIVALGGRAAASGTEPLAGQQLQDHGRVRARGQTERQPRDLALELELGLAEPHAEEAPRPERLAAAGVEDLEREALFVEQLLLVRADLALGAAASSARTAARSGSPRTPRRAADRPPAPRRRTRRRSRASSARRPRAPWRTCPRRAAARAPG